MKERHCDTCTCGMIQLTWSDRSGYYAPENFFEAVLEYSLDHYYDRTGSGVPNGMPDRYANAFAIVVERHLSAVDPDWRNRTVYMNEEQRRAFRAALRDAQTTVDTEGKQ